MTDDTMLPDDDKDLELARRLGDRLADGAPLNEGLDQDDEDRALLRALLAFKETQTGDVPLPEASERMWAGLEDRLDDARPTLRLVRARRWMAVAASVLLLAAAGLLWWLTASDEPALLAAADGSTVIYTTADGSTVTLRPHSRLYAVRQTDDAVRVRLDGEAYFEVVPNAARTFAVEANEALVSVLGTRFDVSTWGRQTTVYLSEGRVRFERLATDEAVVLEPGQRSILTSAGRLLNPTAADGDAYLDWMRNELSLAQEPLRLILAELEHHYDVTLDVAASLRDETLTGRIPLTTLEQSLADLGTVLGGRFVQVNESTYRFEAE